MGAAAKRRVRRPAADGRSSSNMNVRDSSTPCDKGCTQWPKRWSSLSQRSVLILLGLPCPGTPKKVRFSRISSGLSMMNNVIQQLGTTYLNDDFLDAWIKSVRGIAYRVVDVMDHYSYQTLQLEGKSFVKKLFDRSIFTGIADDVKEIEKDIEVIAKMKEQWLNSYQLGPSSQHRPPYNQQLYDIPKHVVDDEDLVGMEANRRLLTEWLYSEEPESTVITVTGKGGLGKSSLVTNVYERERINFQAHAWIVVSQTYTVDDLLQTLFWKICYTEQLRDMDVDGMKEQIKDILKDRKCLIVLDDAWDEAVYNAVRAVLHNPCNGSRLVITTRERCVAALSRPGRRLEIQPICSSDSFDLFCRRAFKKNTCYECPLELQQVSKAIVDLCQGLPPAIISTGRLLSLRPKSEPVWMAVHNKIQCELSSHGDVQGILNICYHELPGHLKNCFLYCCLFPEDYSMTRDSLVRLWVAEGFVDKKGKNTAEQVAEGYLMELIHRNMLQFGEADELGDVTTVYMHDNLRDLAMSISKAQGFGYSTMLEVGSNVRRLSAYRTFGQNARNMNFPPLRTLLALGITEVKSDILYRLSSESRYLAVLELQDSEITEVPASIGNLFNLRYIGLRRTRVKSLPESIEKLSYLQTLDMKQTKIENLPRGIVKIKKLRHLLADNYADEKRTEFRYFVGMQAPKELSNLEELQTLETVEYSNDLAEQLKRLMQLRSLWIDNISAADCANLFTTLSNMPLLSSLLLAAKDENEALCFKDFKPRSADLHRLVIRGQWAEETLNCPIFLGHGTHLKYLALSWCHLGEDPLEMLAPHLPNITYLKLNNMHSARTLVLSAGSFPNLKTLYLRHMHDVSQLHFIDGALPCIEAMYIVSLPKLDKVPQGIESLRSLKKLWLLGLPKGFKTQWVSSGMHQKILHVPEVHV